MVPQIYEPEWGFMFHNLHPRRCPIKLLIYHLSIQVTSLDAPSTRGIRMTSPQARLLNTTLHVGR